MKETTICGLDLIENRRHSFYAQRKYFNRWAVNITLDCCTPTVTSAKMDFETESLLILVCSDL